MKIAKSVFALVFILNFFISCAGAPQRHPEIDELAAAGSFTAALQTMDRERGSRRSVYRAERNTLLFYLNRGMLRHHAGLWEESLQDLHEAEHIIEELFTRSLTMDTASFLVNDTVRPYSGEDYEDIYINVFNALNLYHLGNIYGALVEIRRVNEKLAVLEDRHTRAVETARGANPAMAEVDFEIEAVQFSNSALARYLSLLFSRAMGNMDNVRIDHEQLLLAYQLAPNVYNHPVPSSVADELDIPQGMARLNIIAFAGLSPIKEEENIVVPLPLPAPNHILNFALPVMVDRPSGIEVIEVTLNTGERFRLELLEDMGAVAHETFRARRSSIMARTIARNVIRLTAGEGGAAVAARFGGDLAGTATRWGARLASGLVEQADLRISSFIPGRAYVGGINLYPGTYSITVNFYGAGRRLIATEQHHNMVVREGTLNLAQFTSFGNSITAPTRRPVPIDRAIGVVAVAEPAAVPQPPAVAPAVTPPPPAGEPDISYFVTIHGQSTGPYDIFGLRQLAAAGLLTWHSMVMEEGTENWIIAGTVPELAPLFAFAPAPFVAQAQPQPQIVQQQGFSTGQRWGTFLLNSVIPGLGSFTIMGDTVGGLVNLGLGLGFYLGFILYEATAYRTWYGDWYSNPAYLWGGIGFGVAWLVHNIWRSSTFNRPTGISFIDNDTLNIGLVPGRSGIEGVSFTYTLRLGN